MSLHLLFVSHVNVQTLLSIFFFFQVKPLPSFHGDLVWPRFNSVILEIKWKKYNWLRGPTDDTPLRCPTNT